MVSKSRSGAAEKLARRRTGACVHQQLRVGNSYISDFRKYTARGDIGAPFAPSKSI